MRNFLGERAVSLDARANCKIQILDDRKINHKTQAENRAWAPCD
jgi:hypothetical protein